ncbi:MAG: hypothetical protein V4749_07660 [Pseudomonadota bacterium]
MSPALTVFLLFMGWVAVACAMLWGIVRISRRHHPQAQRQQGPTPAEPVVNTANAPM